MKRLLEKRDLLINSLCNSKVVLFGAGRDGEVVLEQLIDKGVEPAYFIDSDPAITSIEAGGRTFPIHPPDVLLSENKDNLRIIITPSSPFFEEITELLVNMGFESCLLDTHIKGCPIIFKRLSFLQDFIGFCCASSNRFHHERPKLPYLDTAEETSINFLNKRNMMIDEIMGLSAIDVSKPCLNCSRITKRNVLLVSRKIKHITISCYPSICQAKCIYCTVYTNPQNSYEVAKSSRYPKVIAEMIQYLEKKNLLAKSCDVIVAPGEITIMPHKDLLLNSIAKYKAKFISNAFIFDPQIADSLKKNNSVFNVSLDCGTRETFKMIKGLDMFDTVLRNLKSYREHGEVTVKYNILAGVNDRDEDISGIIDIMKSLDINSLVLSFEYKLPLRVAFYPIVKLVQKLTEHNLDFSFHAYYSKNQIVNYIQKYYDPNMRDLYEHKHSVMYNAFLNEFADNYRDYKHHVYISEVVELIGYFKEKARFALLGPLKKHTYIKKAFKKLDIRLHVPDAPYKDAYEMIKDKANVFIMCNRSEFKSINSYICADKGVEGCVLDLESYFYTFEPAQLFLKRCISKKWLNF